MRKNNKESFALRELAKSLNAVERNLKGVKLGKTQLDAIEKWASEIVTRVRKSRENLANVSRETIPSGVQGETNQPTQLV